MRPVSLRYNDDRRTHGWRLSAERADSVLRAQACAVLERYGDTFYVLGIQFDSVGESGMVSTRHWPLLRASPDEWTDSLIASLAERAPAITAAAYLVDRWRPADTAREDSTVVVFHYETGAGDCVETGRPYTFASGGTLRWGPASARPCRRRLWPTVPGEA